MTFIQRLADFSVRADWSDVPAKTRDAIKLRLLDSLGCALGALGSEVTSRVRAHVEELSNQGPCTLIGGGSAPPDRAALYNGALVRYLDFNDSYLAKGETCHPSDNLSAVLAAAEHADASGRDLLAALALAYQVQCRLSDEAPVRARGFDHTAQGCFSIGAGVSRALGLDRERTAHALAICATAFYALRVTRTGALSQWKGLAFPNAAACCTGAVYLARQGVTGPLEAVEGEKGFQATISGPFDIDWSREDLGRVERTVLKRHNAEVHSQSALEAVLELRDRYHPLRAEEIERVQVETFDVAFAIIGGGEEGDKKVVRTKEEADHSLPYLVAVALLDGQVMPAQFASARIAASDVQSLLQRVMVTPRPELSARFPEEMPARVTLELRDGPRLVRERSSYPGFRSEPMTWESALGKFDELGASHTPAPLRRAIADAVADLDHLAARDLMRLLGQVRAPPPTEREEQEAKEEVHSWEQQIPVQEASEPSAPSG
ncbi:MAG: MmgE/PrpD family protein [Deltaproteobacteria bacterium]|nr:MmgE/PrpD family protein [Deltaproteobacteria bacterium]